MIGMLFGIICTILQFKQYPKVDVSATPDAGKRVRRFFKRWKEFGVKLGNYQSRLFLTYLYFVVVSPFGICMRLFGDPLRLKTQTDKSAWVEREKIDTNLQSVRSQF